MKLKAIFITLLIVSFYSNSYSKDIKVRLFSNKNLFTVNLYAKNDDYIILDNKKFKDIQVSIDNSKIKIKSNNSIKSIKKAEFKGNSLIFIKTPNNERAYYGKILIENEKGRLKIINEIDLEKYLESVVYSETTDLSYFEAYKAHSVIARTYTLKAINRHIKNGYNLCDNTHCQLYLGFKNVKPEIIKAVKSTSGEILVYRGQPIWAFYHSICGGATEDSENVWGYEKKEYLQSVVDGSRERPYCFNAPGFKWRTKIAKNKFQAFIEKYIFKNKDILTEIIISSRTSSGRIKDLIFKSKNQSRDIKSVEFYHYIGKYFGWDAVRSTNFKIYYDKKYIIFEGFGNGHGVGLCQHGADEMAKLGYNYKQILFHYYKNVKLIRLKENI